MRLGAWHSKWKALKDKIEPTFIADLVQERSTSLDLDSLYGFPFVQDEALFESLKFKTGMTSSIPDKDGKLNNSGKELPYDLPRKINHADTSEAARPAMIGDGRNDENFAVEQIHHLEVKFHNHVVDQLKQNDPGVSDSLLFEMARDLAVKHCRRVVLGDFVKRYIQDSAFKKAIVKGKRKYLTHSAGEAAFMPTEFSVATYRRGHSQVREQYDWNVNFSSAPFRLIF